MRKLFLIFLFLLIVVPANASEEGVLPFSEFRIASNGIGGSGPILVEGSKNSQGNYVKLVVTAFGKVIEIPVGILKQIPSKYQNGIQLSYETGYETLGGRTVYILFQKGFTSGIQEKFIISVTEKGQSEILGK